MTQIHVGTCRLCGISRGSSRTSSIDVPWMDDARHVAFVSVGAMAPGWTLVSPREHTLNMSDHYRDSRFWSFAEKAVAILEKEYGRCVVFEHGSQSEKSATSCGTAHAHLHIVPLPFPLAPRAKEFCPSLEWRRVGASDISARVEGSEYLFVADQFRGSSTDGYLAILDSGISQFFRRVIAQDLGIGDEYDYTRYPRHAISEQSAEHLKRAVDLALVRAA